MAEQRRLEKMVVPHQQTEKKSQSGTAVHKVITNAQNQGKSKPVGSQNEQKTK